ncbi:MAG: DEAD/DEAH box helicase [Armatimonadetes bacterium]|nr:DEAD/DEAH box helicase [Armatimonadota bacterium]
MTLDQILDGLRTNPRFAGGFTAWREAPARAPVLADFPAHVHPKLREALRSRGIRRLYAHQADAIEAVAAGRSIVVATPTASGKSLCFHVPVLDAILKDPDARALYLFPTKALSADQVDELTGLSGALDAGIKCFTYDGDTPDAARRVIRAAGHIVVTNPDMLHAAILPQHTKWLRLFENLRFVVADELHTYRGVFGSHVANVLRRLRRICRFYGADPQFIACSATIANPKEHADRLTGEDCVLVDRNGAPSGRKVFAIYNPPVVNAPLGIRRDALLEARDMASEFVRNRVQTIAFARSRLRAELLTTYLTDIAHRYGLREGAVRGYRAGYLPSERRAIERGLRDGSVVAVASTNALELGIDIGRLQAALLVGYPGTVASTWQQAGRAGRTEQLSAAILLATSDPLDQYLARHPDFFFGRPAENALAHPDNLLILTSHLKCAAFELPIDVGESFGEEPADEILAYLAENGTVHNEDGRWHYIDQSYPGEEVSLRSASTENVVIIDTTETGKPRVIGEVDLPAAPPFVHEDAIYLHLGRQYHVDRLDWDERKAYVHQVAVDYYTDAQIATDVRVLESFEEIRKAVDRRHGEVSVTYKPTIFKKLKLHTHENVGWGKIHLPESTLHTSAYWVALPPDVLVGSTNEQTQSLLLGLSYALHNTAPLYLMCDSRDLGRTCQIRAPHTGMPTVFLYDAVPGGVGLAPRLFTYHDTLWDTARELIEGCPCESGCPSCVGPILEVGAEAKRLVLDVLRTELSGGRARSADGGVRRPRTAVAALPPRSAR